MTPSWWTGPARALLGMIHLDPLPGSPGSPGLDALIERALADARVLAEHGAAAALLENWKDQSPGPFVDAAAATALGAIARAVAQATRLPLGVNVLPNDYRAAFSLAACGVRFVWLDVFVDRVVTDYAYSPVPPFEVEVDLNDLAAWRARCAPDVALFASVHPKHYRLLDPEDTLEAATERALAAGADAIVVTGAATGSAPDPARVARVAAAVGGRAWTVVGSGVNATNAPALAASADALIVGSSLKPDLSAPLEAARVAELAGVLAGLPPRSRP